VKHFPSRPPWIALAVAVLSLAGCAEPIKGELLQLFINGQVTDNQGAPVADVSVTADQCGLGLAEDTDVTDASGTYEVLLTSLGSAITTCVEVVATPPATLNLRPDTVRIRTVQVSRSTTPDTLMVDLVLDPI